MQHFLYQTFNFRNEIKKSQLPRKAIPFMIQRNMHIFVENPGFWTWEIKLHMGNQIFESNMKYF